VKKTQFGQEKKGCTEHRNYGQWEASLLCPGAPLQLR